jgi:curved DNA-binding protein CbpA
VEQSHYDVLELTASASQDEIKKRYRTLARKYHPDVNSSPEASQKIKQINAAYEILGDAEKRAVYDADLTLKQRVSHFQAEAQAAKPSPPPEPPPKPTAGFDYNGFGRAASQPKEEPKPPPQSEKNTTKRPPPPPPNPAPILEEARLAFANRDLRMAESLCQKVLALDAKNGSAYEMLGDICLKRGQEDRALTCYTFAIQFKPDSLALREKMERVGGKGKGTSRTQSSPIITRTTKQNWLKALQNSEKRDTAFSVLMVLLTLSFIAVVAWVRVDPGTPLLGEISLNALFGMLVGGLEGGILLGFLGRMRPLRDEVSEEKLGKHSAKILLGISLVWFYASLVGYMVLMVRRKQVSASLLRVYGLTILFILLFVVAYTPKNAALSILHVALFGGNVLFPVLLCGWSLADRLRLK